jgi:SAM-dependent methyltransferase
MACPLCNESSWCASWLGATVYRGKEFPYVECEACKSLYCEPMPDEETLLQMYGPQYEMSFAADPAIEDPKQPERVIEWLGKNKPGTFVDYGCGKGDLLAKAAKLDWNVLGIEFADEVARKVEQRTGLKVITSRTALDCKKVADVVHLGDVIEHMTNVNEQMPHVLKLLKPGGLLIAQGPLEGNSNLFTWGIRLSRALRPSARTEMAPYHVMLATRQGQEKCFRRFEVDALEYSVHEVTWPAPARLSASDIRHPRSLALFTLRRLSQIVSAVRPRWGNRYFYVGRRRGNQPGFAEPAVKADSNGEKAA